MSDLKEREFEYISYDLKNIDSLEMCKDLKPALTVAMNEMLGDEKLDLQIRFGSSEVRTTTLADGRKCDCIRAVMWREKDPRGLGFLFRVTPFNCVLEPWGVWGSRRPQQYNQKALLRAVRDYLATKLDENYLNDFNAYHSWIRKEEEKEAEAEYKKRVDCARQDFIDSVL